MIAGCTFVASKPEPVNDVLGIAQNFEPYINNYVENHDHNKSMYETHYFEPWHYQQAPKTLDSVLWPFDVYTKGDIFGNTLQKRETEYFENLQKEANFKVYDTVKTYALSTTFCNLKNFPTHKPLFRDFKQAGEGFPFDYNQNSAVHANEPLYISHYSQSGGWVYVFTSYASGWLRSRDIAIPTPKHRILWEYSVKVHILKDATALYDAQGRYIDNGRIGMLLPLIRTAKKYELLYAMRGSDGSAIYTKIALPKEEGVIGSLALTKENLTQVGNAFLGQEYGWGGVFEDRDCSSMLRDYFSLFGIWLPRNSFKQSQIGEIYSLKELDRDQKIALIQDHAIPFETLLYKKGHIMLYLGVEKNTIIAFHDTWGIKTKQFGKEGRYIIGRSVISTLDIGSNLEDYDETANLLDKLESFNIVTH